MSSQNYSIDQGTCCEEVLYCICSIYPTIEDMVNEIKSNKKLNSKSKKILNSAIAYRNSLQSDNLDELNGLSWV